MKMRRRSAELTRGFGESNNEIVSDRLDELLDRRTLLMRAFEQGEEVTRTESPIEDGEISEHL